MCIKQEQNVEGDQFIGRNGYTLGVVTITVEDDNDINQQQIPVTNEEELHLYTRFTDDIIEEITQNTDSPTASRQIPIPNEEELHLDTRFTDGMIPIASDTLETNNTDQSSEG